MGTSITNVYKGCQASRIVPIDAGTIRFFYNRKTYACVRLRRRAIKPSNAKPDNTIA